MPESGRSRKPDPHPPLAADFTAFWDFAGTVWADPSTRARLMRWQDAFDVDVMLALFAVWYPRPLDVAHWRALETTARHWRTSATGRIRALRRRLHTPDRHALYRAVLDLELQSERLAGLQMLAHARWMTPPTYESVTIDRERRLRVLFPGLPTAEIRDGLHEFPIA